MLNTKNLKISTIKQVRNICPTAKKAKVNRKKLMKAIRNSSSDKLFRKLKINLRQSKVNTFKSVSWVYQLNCRRTLFVFIKNLRVISIISWSGTMKSYHNCSKSPYLKQNCKDCAKSMKIYLHSLKKCAEGLLVRIVFSKFF